MSKLPTMARMTPTMTVDGGGGVQVETIAAHSCREKYFYCLLWRGQGFERERGGGRATGQGRRL